MNQTNETLNQLSGQVEFVGQSLQTTTMGQGARLCFLYKEYILYQKEGGQCFLSNQYNISEANLHQYQLRGNNGGFFQVSMFSQSLYLSIPLISHCQSLLTNSISNKLLKSLSFLNEESKNDS